MAVFNLFEDEPGWTNSERAAKAAKAAYRYAEGCLTRESDGRPESIDIKDITCEDIVDLVTDLYHLAELLGFGAEEIQTMCRQHFQEERDEHHLEMKDTS